jgi:hypothetical protein
MRSMNNLAGYTTAAVGVAATAALLVAYAIFEALRPKMIAFQPLTTSEEGLVNYVGIGLLLTLAFLLLALYQMVRTAIRAQRLSLPHLVVIAGGVLALLFVFGDVALISDIGKQYEAGLSQPEWTILYLVVAFQIAAILGLTAAIVHAVRHDDKIGMVTVDSSVYLLVQYVGVICGGVGLSLTVLNFFFPRPLWMVQAHILPTLIVVLSPYALMAALWVVVKLREGGGEWFDEKQRQDVGASSFMALLLGAVGLSLLYIFSLNRLSGMVSVLWFPFYVFLSLLLFSATNLYRSRDSLR